MLRSKISVNSQYEFVRCLGEGLSSIVYEAIRSNSSGIQSERVAVKVLKSENSVSWLQNEFESLRKVNSPYCVRVLGHEAFEEGPALILEFIEGVTLFEVGSAFQLTISEINHIGAQVYKGLTAIQSVGCVHGDINPKNILLTRDGSIKLIDFGSFTTSSELIGSIPYISREIWEGEKPSLIADLGSWSLIAEDLQSRFTNVPFNKESAYERAKLAKILDVPMEENHAASLDLSVKVEKLLSARTTNVGTAIISQGSSNYAPKQGNRRIEVPKRHFLAGAVASLIFAVLFPAQNLLSKPLKSAEPAILLVRTHDWTELSVNGVSKGYAPLNLNNLPSGEYRIKYKRQRGQGELTLHLNPGQRRLLRDADFKD